MDTERRTYRSDITDRSDTTDEQWQLLGPELERLSPESHLGQPQKFHFEKCITRFSIRLGRAASGTRFRTTCYPKASYSRSARKHRVFRGQILLASRDVFNRPKIITTCFITG